MGCHCDKSRLLCQSVQEENPQALRWHNSSFWKGQSQSISDPCVAEYSRQGLVGVAGPKPCPDVC